METLTAMDIAQSPPGHQRCRTCQLPIGTNYFVGRSDENRIVHGISHWRTELGRIVVFSVEHDGVVAVGQLCPQFMTASREVHGSRGRGRKPEILHLHHGLPVNTEVVSSCHFLSDVEQQRIITFLCYVDGGSKDVTLAHFFLAAFRGSHIHDLPFSCFRLSLKAHTVPARIQFGQSVVVPQYPPSFV